MGWSHATQHFSQSWVGASYFVSGLNTTFLGLCGPFFGALRWHSAELKGETTFLDTRKASWFSKVSTISDGPANLV